MAQVLETWAQVDVLALLVYLAELKAATEDLGWHAEQLPQALCSLKQLPASAWLHHVCLVSELRIALLHHHT